MRPHAEYLHARQLLETGLSSIAVSQRLGIPSSTVRLWRRAPARVPRRRSLGKAWRPRCDKTYCYVLGLYLGDGHLATPRGYPFLRIFLDARYEELICEAHRSLERLWPEAKVGHHGPAGVQLAILQLSDIDLPFAFPQHGPGKKHTRPIALERWQSELTARHPEALLRGLIHSDGCRTVNRFRTTLPSGRVAEYEYPRYFFSNLSTDIRGIFTDHCELLGIRWTQSNPRNISVSHRDSVARLDVFVGPKT